MMIVKIISSLHSPHWDSGKKCLESYENNFICTSTSFQFLKCSFSILMWITLKTECIIDFKLFYLIQGTNRRWSYCTSKIRTSWNGNTTLLKNITSNKNIAFHYQNPSYLIPNWYIYRNFFTIIKIHLWLLYYYICKILPQSLFKEKVGN